MSRKISREKAKARGLPRYFTGKPCKHDHVAEKYTCNRTCVECGRGGTEKLRRYSASPLGHERMRRYSASPLGHESHKKCVTSPSSKAKRRDNAHTTDYLERQRL